MSEPIEVSNIPASASTPKNADTQETVGAKGLEGVPGRTGAAAAGGDRRESRGTDHLKRDAVDLFPRDLHIRRLHRTPHERVHELKALDDRIAVRIGLLRERQRQGRRQNPKPAGPGIDLNAADRLASGGVAGQAHRHAGISDVVGVVGRSEVDAHGQDVRPGVDDHRAG